jgi:DNA-binding LacI/PurR family transcriptional regulator
MTCRWLLGFDDVLQAQYCTPVVTTICKPALAIELDAARAMLGMLNGAQPSVSRPAPELVLRGSTLVGPDIKV